MDLSQIVEPRRFSYSQFSLYAKCPTAYHYKYVLGFTEKPVYNMVAGSAGHKALQADNEALINGAATLTKQQVFDTAVEYFETNSEELEGGRVENIDPFVKDLKPPLGYYVENRDVIGKDRPESAERRHEVLLYGTIPFVAIIDVTYADQVIDYKFVGRRKSQREVDFDPQLFIYQGIAQRGASFLQLLKGKDDMVLTSPGGPKGKTTRYVESWAKSTAASIESCKATGVWAKSNPTNFWCGEGCPFYFECWK